MLSNDFNTIETKSSFFFAALLVPFAFIGIILILIVRFGWTGILAFVVLIAFFPIQVAVGEISGKIIQEVNAFKDKRMKTCT